MAKGWHNGSQPGEPTGYGIRLDPPARDAVFDRSWEEVEVELDGGPTIVVPLSASFWKSCPELRSAEIGSWLLEAGAAPWEGGDPPRVAVRQTDANRFTARLMGAPRPI